METRSNKRQDQSIGISYSGKQP